ncbi:Het-C-domain-containing protein [Mycena belliarum]|uniref:Het-C-domain-containing protein n=1 Tax=Mycena belliarum TaxID=1033014 RepID=A0AAD6ULC4_9AGAR|nr:Het-C-domain-containing protein [Mycena belliae]
MSNRSSPNFAATLLLITIVLVLLPETVYAFGAGDIPDFAFLNDKAFRHGDIENILSTLAKTAGHVAAAKASTSGGDLLGFAKSIIKTAATGAAGNTFSSGDIKKVYFGNWLRDYSQAMDIAGLSKLTAESLVLVVSVLGFMTFGFATQEFEVTADRLGVYLPVEHIDNPKGYAAKEGDARSFHPKLRPPVDPRELEVDTRTGMKNYMASENQGWDTSTAHIRRILTQCIEVGRRAQGREGPELFEAYRLLGTGLHTLEDLLAHSNWVEIALRKMGHSEVFCHVGDDTEIETPNGRAPPLVTGTFGGADFLHSLMGEATDKLSQASVTDLASKMSEAQEGDNSNVSALKAILTQLPIGGSDKMDQGEELHAQAKAYSFDPDNIAPPEVQQKLSELLQWHDDLMRSILEKIDMIPGLEELMDQLSNALNAYVYTVIAPWITPILQQATSVLGEGSKAVIDTEDQFEVFDNPRASDPSHSLLSKDHFGLILNEPAGKIAVVVVEHSVKIIVKAWSDHGDPSQAIDAILEAFHHPYYADGRSTIQNDMFQVMERWFQDLGDQTRDTLQALTKESVREGKNKRLGSENEDLNEPGYGGCGHGAPQRRPQGQTQGQTQGGNQQRQQQHGGATQSAYASGGGRNTSSNNQASGYSSSRRDDGNQSGRGQESRRQDNNESYGGREESSGYAPSYTQPQERSSGHGSSGYGRTEEPSYGGGNETAHGRSEQQSYGGGNTQSSGHHASSGYGRTEESSYGGGNESSGRGASGYGRSEAQTYGGGEKTSSGHHGSSGYGRTEEQSYGGGNEHGSSGRGASGYGGSEAQTYNSSAYGSSNRGASAEESQYGRGEERTGGYGRTEERSGGQERQGHHGRGAHHGGGDRDETFGAERLNLDENQGYNRGSRKNEYESNY